MTEAQDRKEIPCEVWSRVCGFFRPVSHYNPGKKSEFADRKEICPEKAVYAAVSK